MWNTTSKQILTQSLKYKLYKLSLKSYLMKEFIDKLKSMGLTEYEAKAYLALLQKANMTAEQISNLSEVPLPRVYGVLEQLAIKGFIKILPGRPRKFEAIEPRIAFESYMKYK
ncbi:MAG: hypothetical protein DRJ31_11030, partial [Candidatus Methanomethylicota archaeon]